MGLSKMWRNIWANKKISNNTKIYLIEKSFNLVKNQERKLENLLIKNFLI